LGGAGEEGFGREDAVGSDQAGDLGVEREEGEKVGEASEAGEKPEADGVVHGESGGFDYPTFPGKWDDFCDGWGWGRKKIKKRPNPFALAAV